jgi:predicted nuclease of restriction endonuclease-like (RecB) superfamily
LEEREFNNDRWKLKKNKMQMQSQIHRKTAISEESVRVFREIAQMFTL